MTYSFTEKKRIRKDFGQLPAGMEIPYLLAIQVESYAKFLQRGVRPSRLKEHGIHGAFRSVFPISSYSGTAALDYTDYKLGEPPFDVRECVLRGFTYAAPLRVKMRLIIYDRESPGKKSIKDIKEQEVFMGEIPLMTEHGTFVINGTERVVVSQLHRSPGVVFDHDKGKTHSSGKVLHNARVIPYRGSWLDFEFDPKDILYVRIDRKRKLPATVLLRALGYTAEEILKMFFEKTTFHVKKAGFSMDLAPERLRGDILTFDIKDASGKVVVEAGRRVTARHVRLLAKSARNRMDVPRDYILERVTAVDIANRETGEIVVPCNTEITEEILDTLVDAGVKRIETIYTNEIDRGPFISKTLREDSTSDRLTALVDIYHMMRPGEPPTREAAENLFNNLFFAPDRYDLSAVGRMKFNRRLGKSGGTTVLTNEDIVDVLKTLIDIKNGKGAPDDIDHLGNRRVKSVGEMAENQFRLGLVRVERAVNPAPGSGGPTAGQKEQMRQQVAQQIDGAAVLQVQRALRPPQRSFHGHAVHAIFVAQQRVAAAPDVIQYDLRGTALIDLVRGHAVIVQHGYPREEEERADQPRATRRRRAGYRPQGSGARVARRNVTEAGHAFRDVSPVQGRWARQPVA